MKDRYIRIYGGVGSCNHVKMNVIERKKHVKRHLVYELLKDLHRIKTTKIIEEAEKQNIDKKEVKEIISLLKEKGMIYQPKPGILEIVEY